MPQYPIQHLLDIDRASRPPEDPLGQGRFSDGRVGLTDLIARDPAVRPWLAWICQSVHQHTCGAIEELNVDDESIHPAHAGSADGTSENDRLPLVLTGADNVPIVPVMSTNTFLRFSVTPSGVYRLFTTDRPLLWAKSLINTNTSHPPDLWRLAAAPPDAPPELPPDVAPDVRDAASDSKNQPTHHWELARWGLKIDQYQTDQGRWLDITQQRRPSDA